MTQSCQVTGAACRRSRDAYPDQLLPVSPSLQWKARCLMLFAILLQPWESSSTTKPSSPVTLQA